MSLSAQQYVSDAIGRPSLSVVVCAYTLDRWDDLLSSVKSIVAQLTANDDVIVVIDYNDDLLRSAQSQLATVSAPAVTVIANDGKQGMSGARNTGVARAVGAFVDDDAAVEPGWATNLLRPFVDPGVAGVGRPVAVHFVASLAPSARTSPARPIRLHHRHFIRCRRRMYTARRMNDVASALASPERISHFESSVGSSVRSFL